MEPIEVYTDGGCSGNPGPGAWAFLIEDGGQGLRDSGFEPATTNNRMELSAVMRALGEIRRRPEWRARPVRVHTDSRYVQQGITSWIDRWERNGWRTKSKEPVKNRDLWETLRGLSRALSVQWTWLEAHAGHPQNEACDRLVQETIRRRG